MGGRVTCEVCCIAPAERCRRCLYDHEGDWPCGAYVCEACRPAHDREAHPPEPDSDYAMEQRRDDARRTT